MSSTASVTAAGSTSTDDRRIAIIIAVCVTGGVLLLIAALLTVILVCEHRRRRHSSDISGRGAGSIRTRVRGHYHNPRNGNQVGQRRGSVVTGQQLNYAWTEDDGNQQQFGKYSKNAMSAFHL